MKIEYEVEVSQKFPPAGTRPGIVKVFAQNKQDAIRRAKAKMKAECIFDRHDGPIQYRIVCTF